MKKTEQFLSYHRLRAADIEMDSLVKTFLHEMDNGLEGKESSLRMIPTYIEAENDFLTEVPVLAIDAGGTNFRAALISFNNKGKLVFGDIANYRMPGLDRKISSEEFFKIISGYVKPLARKAERIGFCFSYPTEILPNRDGRLIQFCKEVQAPEVVGQLIGKNLLETLETPDKHLVLLNDTVATLLAGKSASFNRTFDSFIGYILGTGTNTCYIEKNRNIIKTRDLDSEKSMIINIESGNFGKAPRSDLDLIFDKSTTDPGNYSFEKMFSGGYFGGLCLSVLKAAASEGFLSESSGKLLNTITALSSNDASNFVSHNGTAPIPNAFGTTEGDFLNPASGGSMDQSPADSAFENVLKGLQSHENDSERCREIINSLIDRAAKLVASNIAAVVLKTGKGKSPSTPILITVDGTTFYKMHNLRERFEKYFNEYLSGEKKRFAEFTEVRQSSLIGAALAALI